MLDPQIAFQQAHNQVTGRDFIVFSVLPWLLELGSNSRNIAYELALAGNRVLYLDPPLDRNTVIKRATDPDVQRKKEVLNGKRPALRPAPDRKNIWLLDPDCVLESINMLPDGAIYDFFNKRNAQRLARSINKAAAQLNFKDAIVLIDNDILRTCFLRNYLACKTYLYYSRDYLQGVPYWQRHGKRLEPVHMQIASAVVANSEYLRDWAQQHQPNSFYIGQGCNTEHFNPDKDLEIPHDWPVNDRPKIIYAGYLTTLRIDEQLLVKLAELAPGWDFILVGPSDPVFEKSLLRTYPNVFFLGKKAIQNLPAYLYHSDVCINPQVLNEITIGNYPLKVDEYLAMGKPCVATRTKFMESFGNLCELATTPEEWVSAISTALADNQPGRDKARRAFAKEHSWENCAKAIFKAINTVEAQ